MSNGPKSEFNTKAGKNASCSKRQLDLINMHYLVSDIEMLSRESSCPNPLWLDDIFAKGIVGMDRVVTGISIGCNTGIDAITQARRMSGNAVFSESIWFSLFEKFSQRKIYAACPENQKHEDMSYDSSRKLNKIEFHCIEPLGSTFNALIQVSEALGLDNHGFHVHRFVISNDSGFVLFPKGSAGVESLGVGSLLENECSEIGRCDNVSMTTLNSFVKTYVNYKDVIDFLFIDTEGFDWRVLQSAYHVLQRTRYLEFEYHDKWESDQSLKHASKYMEKIGFTCYYAGKGKLLKITHGCWTEKYEMRKWSNVACVHSLETFWSEIMESYFNLTLSRFRRKRRKKKLKK